MQSKYIWFFCIVVFGKAKAVNNTFRIIYQQSNIAMDVNIGMYVVCTMLWAR